MTDRMQTRFTVADNSGAKTVGLIWVRNRKRPQIGTIITVSVKNVNSYAKVKRSGVYNAIVVRTSLPFRRKNGSIIELIENSVIMLEKNTRELDTKKMKTIAAYLALFLKK